ncbi:uncharacterized protein K452DRAFT_294744 [Aplosporella prunicola CBS 121167]|uniref:Conserved oligomeric Golgi complex subunit 1 n=1 Tax=Aplosporella prunicola CBS 121167 TaxID=1176127 RepID=A0A6A6BPS2_9PEZI|nr:uncharacterized protein K452DRAFT_294744 [Aplosporella prunicola CBS 121167]KAF2146139.1 hypothetical protein K452DRAFT_294744 [Aplosporella prunicola CBS 121167]
MASEAPDPRSFATWEDAFQYPVPVVRKLEQQLRSNANENREKLRSLVGASYRDLLGTAERIIEMDNQMEHVETTLGSVGQKCNSRMVDRIGKNYAGLSTYIRKYDGERYAFAAQLAVLQSCPTVIRRMLKRRSTLTAAKLLVLSRLLHKTLSATPDVPPFVDALQSQLASLRRKLLHSIDKQFSKTSAEIADILESMCAFSLATSSTPSDVLRHFHHVRLESITRHVEEGRTSQEHLPRALKLYVKTLNDTHSIFPRRLAEALVKLKARPLLQDQEIQTIAELNLDIHERWIVDEVRNFTPWPRHDELSKADSEKLTKTWAKQAMNTFLDNLRKVLADQEDPKAVLEIRRGMLDTWLLSGTRNLGVDPANVLDDLRDVVNDHLRSLLSMRASRLNAVFSELSDALTAWQEGKVDQPISLWDPSTTSIDITNGAPAFKQAIVERSHGIDSVLRRLIDTYEIWARSIEEASTVVKEMKDTKWDDDLDGDDDYDFALESKQALLSEDDPRSLEDSLHEALVSAHKTLQEDVANLVSATLTGASQDSSSKAILILRLLREISQRLLNLTISTRHTAAISSGFPSSTTRPLHLSVASVVVSAPLSNYMTSMEKFFRSNRTRARALWEGNPPLPVQPSVPTFKFLMALNKGMVACGDDLWSAGAVGVLKDFLTAELGAALDSCIKSARSSSKAVAEGSIAGDDSQTGAEKDQPVAEKSNDDVQRDRLTHLLFDVLYLQKALAQRQATRQSPLVSLENQLRNAVDADAAMLDRLRKQAADYWKRTYLLFALLM